MILSYQQLVLVWLCLISITLHGLNLDPMQRYLLQFLLKFCPFAFAMALFFK